MADEDFVNPVADERPAASADGNDDEASQDSANPEFVVDGTSLGVLGADNGVAPVLEAVGVIGALGVG